MINIKKSKELFSFWLNKTNSKSMQDAIEDDDLEKATLLFRESFNQGLVEKK